jgi:hypothetical protein
MMNDLQNVWGLEKVWRVLEKVWRILEVWIVWILSAAFARCGI